MACRGGGNWGVVHGCVNALFAMDSSQRERRWGGGLLANSGRDAGAGYEKGAGDVCDSRKPSNKRYAQMEQLNEP
jgi:hypothetical protein